MVSALAAADSTASGSPLSFSRFSLPPGREKAPGPYGGLRPPPAALLAGGPPGLFFRKV